MPVVDTPVHPSTSVGDDHRYGCHNKPRIREPYHVKNGYARLGRNAIQRVKVIEESGSPECRYDRSMTDASCTGCEHRGSGEQYAEDVRKRGK